jgi:predicted ribosome quality control (RQC) complex YloA/Tae2 family protein
MLSLKELQRAVGILESRLIGARVQRAVQPDDYRLVLAYRGAAEGHSILISCRPEFVRISSVVEIPEPATPPLSFGQYMRAHLPRATVDSLWVSDTDRQAAIRLRGREGLFELRLSFLGNRSNLYLLDSQQIVLHALRPLEDTRRELALGGPWSDPAPPPPMEIRDRWADVSDAAYLHAIEDTYRDLECKRDAETLSRTIESVLAREQAFLERKSIHLQEDLAEARQAQHYRRTGELLKSVLHSIRPGDTSATAVDFETGESVSIPLDPSLSPGENLERYFGRYQKELRGVAAIQQQIETVLAARSRVETLCDQVRAIGGSGQEDLQRLHELAAHSLVRRLIGRYRPESRKPDVQPKKRAEKKEIPARLQPKRYRTEQGLEIWVGRSDEGNDYLTTRLARGNDLFFHLQGYPGSHVVLRTEGRTDPPSESVLDACELAVHFSKLKGAGRADVHVAAVKDVKKPRGAKSGLVYATRVKTIHLRRNPKRLENILASRLED